MLVLLFIAFISGLLTILAPCIWPLLPVVLSATVKGGRRRPFGITLGIVVSFAVFTLAISYLEHIVPIDPNWFRVIAVVIIGFFGVSLLLPSFSRTLEGLVSSLSGKLGGRMQQNTSSGFTGGFITGISLGIVWTPCAGPILAAIATLAATRQVSTQIVLVTIFYMLGVAIPLFIFATVGSWLLGKTKKLTMYTGHIQQVLGVIMILTAVAIFFNIDKQIEAGLLSAFPEYASVLTSIEKAPTVTKTLQTITNQSALQETTGLSDYGPAPDFAGITNWLNTNNKPLTLASLKGKVVLVDFWTYTCINCIRTLPHVTAWYNIYKNQGFVVIGVHTPEFAFEHTTSNVAAAIKQFGIKYPVAQDNNYGTWDAYQNQYWPAEYLIDATGEIRHVHFGEDEYGETEQAIRELLAEKTGKPVKTAATSVSDTTPQGNISPESYVGSERMQFAYPEELSPGMQTLTLPSPLPSDHFGFGGTWNIAAGDSVAKKNAVIDYHFTAQHVYLVMAPSANGAPSTVSVLLDGKKIPASVSGADVKDGVVTIDRDRLYSLFSSQSGIENHTLELRFTPGISVFAFTFG